MINFQESKDLIEKAVSGNQAALETLLSGIRDMVFNLSLRMLGTIPDAEDATQEILVKVMTSLSAFRQESSFSTWVFRIAVNHLKTYRKNLFSQHPLSFEDYGQDIVSGKEKDIPDLSGGVEQKLLERELKLSCSNVMLQCLDTESRCIFILGTMFRLDSRVAGEILGISPEAYRQRLSRIRKKMAAFLGEYCGLSGTGACSCAKRIHYAIASHRIDPHHLDYVSLEEAREERIEACTDAMEQIDAVSQVFTVLPAYRATEKAVGFIRDLMASKNFQSVTKE